MKSHLIPDNFDLESFLNTYQISADVKLAERLKKDFGKYSAFLGEQIKLFIKARAKLPTFVKHFCLYTTRSLEQASSETLAAFKARRFNGSQMLDLTGGLGVDDAAFSGSFKKVISVDNDAKLNEIARYNFTRLGINNVERIDADADKFVMMNHGAFDFVYIDSDRRANAGPGKSVTLHDAEPSVLKLKSRLFELSALVLLKLSPLIDLTYLAKVLPETEFIYVVSLENEVKEILALLNRSFSGRAHVAAIDISARRIEKEFMGILGEKVEIDYDINGRYFYDPASALIKSGVLTKYAKQNKLKLIGKNSSYMLGAALIKDYFGRKFEIISQLTFGKSGVKKYLRENNIEKANVAKRDFPISVVELSKIFRLKDGGEDYLFFTKSVDGEKLMYHTRKLIIQE